MRFLTRKQQSDAINRIVACQIIANNYINDIDAYDHITSNLALLAHDIGNVSGIFKVSTIAFCRKDELYAETPGECADLQSGE